MDKNRILKALSNPVRLEMLTWLKKPEKHFPVREFPLEPGICAGEFERSGLPQSTVSSHLGVLQRAGLVSTRRVGQWVFYSRNEKAVADFLACLRREI
ncbi:helix-turn-helix transcriptional regulator [Rhizobium sp. P32RR-XVIII]|uniref:ArsR/SmtB family transcription factor n=1 Tax=Rhizobium sp. P32RR-XVIII TaxID=2726738 RepID=UPI001456C411|nr:metalloregulator ArsR/SmtB family transcription factor [Rhizobium sp. P32RR-XVIII]NLS07705.1 helix-turn-helix transcriptional regulator [Rhizobium sp. P32RR-XVIII]